MNMDGKDVHSRHKPVSKVAVDLVDLLLTSAVADVIIKPLRFD